MNKKSFLLGSYGSLSDGLKEVDNVLYNGVTGEKFIDQKTTPVKSFINDEFFKIYKDSGLQVVKCGNEVYYNGEPYETSSLKNVLDLCYKHNIQAIIGDVRLDKMARKEDLSKDFKSEKELEDYVINCIKDYCDHPALFGINLIDEPSYRLFPSIGKIFRAIKKYRPDNRVIVNLLPLAQVDGTAANYCEGGTADTFVESYEKYLTGFIDATGADYVMLDSYPFCENEEGVTRVGKNYLLSVKVVAEYCKKRNLDFYFIVQSFDLMVYEKETKKLIPYYRKCDGDDLALQANLAMGAGVSFLLYFTYFPHRGNCTTTEMFGEEGCFLRRNGEITPLYKSAQKLHKQMQEIAPTILKYRYNAMNAFVGERVEKRGYIDCITEPENTFAKINGVTVNKDGAVLVIEMYNREENSYAYMIINVLDPADKRDVATEITIAQNNAVVCKNGVFTEVILRDGKINLTLKAGEGVFVEVK